jgi:hypothetical protein
VHTRKALACAAAFVALAVVDRAQAQVQSVVIQKEFNYVQTGPGTAALDTASNNFGFSADVNGKGIGGIPAPTLAGPYNGAALEPTNNGGKLVYSPGDTGWRWGTFANDFGTSSQSSLDSFFPNGTYTITVNGVGVPLTLTGNAYPNMPILTLSGGAWSGGKYVIDVSQPLVVTTNAFTGYGTHRDDHICAGLIGPGFEFPFSEVAPWGCGWLQGFPNQFHSTAPSANSATFTMPAYSLVAGGEYTMAAFFEAIVDEHPVAALPGSTNVASYTVFTKVTVSVAGTSGPPANGVQVSGSDAGTDPAGGSHQASFTCTGTPTCIGTATLNVKAANCSNAFTFSSGVTITGLDLSHAGPLAGMRIRDTALSTTHNPDGSCSYATVATPDTASYTGTWNGTGGTFVISLRTPQGAPYTVSGTFTSNITLTPVFPMTVTGNVTPTQANVSAQIQYRPQDVGKTQSVYVFALAPASVVKNGTTEKAARMGPVAHFLAEDDPVPCVLAQVNGSGQLSGVTASTMQPYTSGVLNSQGQSVTILNNVPTPNVAGATFFVGYGPDAGTMINTGVNRTAVTVPGSLTCAPQPPQTGWWWNPAEGGRGFSIEAQGNNLFFAIFHYDASGRATWNVSPGPVSLGGSYFAGDFYGVTGGQTLGGAYKAPTATKAGAITLNFSDASHGTMTWPGGTIPIERMNFIPGSLAAPPLANQPENGWWWNPQESGRGFFIEWQQDRADIAGYMYDDQGNPIWYISVFPTPDARTFSGSWWQFANGQAMGGAYKPATQTNANVAPVTIQFQSATTATMTLPNGRTTNLVRQRF